VPGPHLPLQLPRPVRPVTVVPLDLDLGVCAGHRFLLRSLEVWDGWADLRFARVDEGAPRPLPRRVPPVAAWSVTSGDEVLEVLDAVGRGDREFSNGEVRLCPAPTPDARLEIEVELVPGEPPLVGGVRLPAFP
jgi:hypothetical protein